MRFARIAYQPILPAPQPAFLPSVLRPWAWLVEIGLHPPQTHRPALLLAGTAPQGGVAYSLSSATVLKVDLGMTLTERLVKEGCGISTIATLALHEIMLNAAIHGNLEVGSGPSRDWRDFSARQNKIDEALADPAKAARAVTVAIGWNVGSMVAVIADQGSGYRAKALASGQPGMSPRAAGRGLMIARAVAKVEVLGRGRSTRLVFALGDRLGTA